MPSYLVGPTRPYTTITSAIAAIPINLSGTGIHIVEIDAGTYNEAFGTGTHTNASASDYIVIRAASGSEHLGFTDSGVIINFTASTSSDGISVTTPFTRLENLVVRRQNGSGSTVELNTSNCTVRNVIALSVSGTIAFSIPTTSTGNVFINCLAIRSGSTLWNGFSIGGNSTAVLYNCGSYGFQLGYQKSAGSTVTVVNCWARIGSGGLGGFDGTYSASSTNNASSTASAPGSNPLTSVSTVQFAFVDPNNFDFHISESSVLYNAGASQAGVFTQDWDLQTIFYWCIGPDSYPAPEPSVSTVASPWKDTNAPHKRSRDAKLKPLRIQYGEPSDSQSVHANAPEARGVTNYPRSKFLDGFVSLMGETNGFNSTTTTIGTGFRIPIVDESLTFGAEFAEKEKPGLARASKMRTVLPQVPSGEMVFPYRTNDSLPVLMSFFQTCIGTTPAIGTTYYEFVPSQNAVRVTGSSFGTGSYGANAGDAFTLSVYKEINGTGARFYRGIAQGLSLMVEPSGEAMVAAKFLFSHGSFNDTSQSRAGSFSTKSTFPGHRGTFSLSLPNDGVAGFRLDLDNGATRRKTLGGTTGFAAFGRCMVTGTAVLNFPHNALSLMGSMLNGSTFSASGTFFNSGVDMAVISLPNCVYNYTDVSIDADYLSVPFTAYESESGSVPAIAWRVWTSNYSATTFEPN